ncbi:unnamed protein product [Peniophora sp. CBMAI 1063]|nr:unnamed protein product [Peniophora sp. CBMAI 1063]
MSDISILSFNIRDSDINALLAAERMSRSVIESFSATTDPSEVLDLLQSTGVWLEDAVSNLQERTLRINALLNERVNAAPAVARLNPDVLRLVFTFVADIENRPRYPRKNTWVRLGHVCRQWRGVLLGAAHLWARDLFAFPQGFSDILPRTLGVPLDLNLYEFGKWRTERRLLDLGLPLLDRARLLACYPTSPADVLSVAESLCAHPIPSLEEVQIIVDSSRSASFSIPHTQLTDHSHLHRLSMTNVFLRPPSSCSALVTLEILLEDYNLDMMPSSATLLGILSMSPRMQTFALQGWIDRNDAPGATSVEPIIMAQLIQLKLHLGSRENNRLSAQGGLQRFVASLRLPALTHADIAEFAWPDEIAAFVSSVNTILTTSAGAPSLKDCARLTVAHGLHNGNQSSFDFELAELRRKSGKGSHLRVSLQVSESHEPEDMALTVSAFERTLYTHGMAQRVKCLDWSANTQVMTHFAYWVAAFAHFDGVEMIYVRSDGHCSLESLSARSLLLPSGGMLLPALRRIVVDDRFLHERLGNVTLYQLGIVRPLQSRRAIGKPISTLGVEGLDIVTGGQHDMFKMLTRVQSTMGVELEFSLVDDNTSEWGECGTNVRFIYPDTGSDGTAAVAALVETEQTSS